MIKTSKKRKRRLKVPLTARQKDMRGASYKSWRYTVLFKDSHKCIICGKSKTLNVHHIYPYHSYPNLRYDINNGATLCKLHHKEFHHIYGTKHFTPANFETFKRMKKISAT